MLRESFMCGVCSTRSLKAGEGSFDHAEGALDLSEYWVSDES